MPKSIRLKHIGIVIVILKSLLVIFFILKLTLSPSDVINFQLDKTFLFFIIAGFVAQMIDGTLGMAYGVSCSTLLIHLGIPPALASASVHTAEVFTTGVSGLSHLIMKNVDKNLFLKLAIPGIIGSSVGAYIISDILSGKAVKPFVAGYLLFMGVVIIIKTTNSTIIKKPSKSLIPLGLIGGFFDAIGGGGWGPIVTSNLIMQGRTPRITVGTVNTAEFFVTIVSTIVFLFFLGTQSWKIILGLIIGGTIAAPIGAILSSKLQGKRTTIAIGLLIVLTSLYTIWNSTP